jgi:surface protein
MFNYCKKLNTIIFPKNSKSSNVESFMEMFAHAESLTSIDLTYFSFVKAKNMGYMFNGCKNLVYINFPKNEKAENLQLLNNMFDGCLNLISVDLSSFSFKNVETMAYMFNDCYRLSTLILPKENNTSNALQNAENMFYNCKELTSIDLSGINFANVKDLSFMFYGCSKLESLILPSNEKETNVTDFSNMSFDYGKLASIDLIGILNGQNISYIFFICSNLMDIKFPTEENATKIEDF